MKKIKIIPTLAHLSIAAVFLLAPMLAEAGVAPQSMSIPRFRRVFTTDQRGVQANEFRPGDVVRCVVEYDAVTSFPVKPGPYVIRWYIYEPQPGRSVYNSVIWTAAETRSARSTLERNLVAYREYRVSKPGPLFCRVSGFEGAYDPGVDINRFPRTFASGDAGITVGGEISSTPVNRPPVARIDAMVGGQRVQEGQELRLTARPGGEVQVNFSGSRSQDPDGQLTRYLWRTGTGQIMGAAREVLAAFRPGAHLVTLTVRDAQGATSQAQVRVVVKEFEGRAAEIVAVSPLRVTFHSVLVGQLPEFTLNVLVRNYGEKAKFFLTVAERFGDWGTVAKSFAEAVQKTEIAAGGSATFTLTFRPLAGANPSNLYGPRRLSLELHRDGPFLKNPIVHKAFYNLSVDTPRIDLGKTVRIRLEGGQVYLVSNGTVFTADGIDVRDKLVVQRVNKAHSVVPLLVTIRRNAAMYLAYFEFGRWLQGRKPVVSWLLFRPAHLVTDVLTGGPAAVLTTAKADLLKFILKLVLDHPEALAYEIAKTRYGEGLEAFKRAVSIARRAEPAGVLNEGDLQLFDFEMRQAGQMTVANKLTNSVEQHKHRFSNVRGPLVSALNSIKPGVSSLDALIQIFEIMREATQGLEGYPPYQDYIAELKRIKAANGRPDMRNAVEPLLPPRSFWSGTIHGLQGGESFTEKAAVELMREGTTLKGRWQNSFGESGSLQGTLVGNQFNAALTISTPGCPGTGSGQGSGQISPDGRILSARWSGKTCEGSFTAQGTFTRS